ncbi:MAG TPA: SEC-C metal-binding domain-containing protein, partial [Beijerinckiaceae bacterium]
REPGELWAELAYAAASLGLLKLWPLARAACREGLIPARIVRMRDLEDEFRDVAADFARESAAMVASGGPLDTVFADMERWAREAPAEDGAETDEAGADEAGEEPADPGQPYVDPLRAVGRNDPCPCGSGKKHKKCCLAA